MLRPEGQIGRYELRRRVATGGMGTLYLAHDPVLDRTVALKLFHADLDRPDARDRFVGEARAVAALNHPNIVTIYDYGEYSSQPFLVMEYIQGETLADFIRRKPLVAAGVTVRWMEELCSAVGYAHDRDIIHRDIKPANLMVDAYGRLKVLDFGIARMRGTLASQATAVVGTPGYIAPEQIRGGTIDHRSDLFSIGAVCYELFTYAEAFGGETMHAMTHRTLNDDPVPLEAVRPSIDPELAGIVGKALQKDTERRFQSAEELRDALATQRRRLEAAEPETMMSYVPPPEVAGAGKERETASPTGGLRGVTTPHAVQSQGRPQRRTTREALARQRAVQSEGWVQLAREHAAAGEVVEAREACVQALALEPAHEEAAKLLESFASSAQTVLSTPARAPHEPAEALEDIGHTVMVPMGHRSASSLAPSEPAPVVAPSALTSATPVVMKPSQAPSPRQRVTPPAAKPAPKRSFRRSALAAAATAVLLVAAAVIWMVMRAAPAALPVLVVIDAAPWAVIASVERASGEKETLPPEASTPLALALVPGAYRVSLVGPPPVFEPRQVSISVLAGKPSNLLLERFATVSVDDYFRANVSPNIAPSLHTSGTPEGTR